MSTPRIDRRNAVDALALRLRATIAAPIESVWTPELASAARPVNDVWPERLAAAITALELAFAAYRPLVEAPVPVEDRRAAVQAIDDAAATLNDNLSSTTTALIAARQFKTPAEQTSIDGARDTLDSSAVATTTWLADVQRFDASIG